MLDLNPLADDQKLLAQVIDYYHRTLKETTEGLDYLRSRGVTVGEAIDRFRIGYANRTLGLKLPVKRVKAGKEIRTRLQQLGIYRGTGREHYNGCVTFPIMAADGSGQIVDIYGRKTNDHLRKGTPLHMHLSDQRRGVWNVEAFAGRRRNHPLPVALRRPDVLERRLSQRDLHLRPGCPDRRPSCSLPRVRHPAGACCGGSGCSEADWRPESTATCWPCRSAWT